MSIKAVLFDLDGTLLPMDQDEYLKAYFKGLATKMAPAGFAPKPLINAVWAGSEAMIKNDGRRSNEEVFWKSFVEVLGDKVLSNKHLLDDFYLNEYEEIKSICGYREESKQMINLLKSKGIRVILATNPLFPAVATEHRIRWAGLEPEDFELYTTYENIGYCKPNLEYYRDILRRCNLAAQDCLMVGNDVDDDMVTTNLGMQTYLLTNDLINKNNVPLENFTHGTAKELLEYFKTL